MIAQSTLFMMFPFARRYRSHRYGRNGSPFTACARLFFQSRGTMPKEPRRCNMMTTRLLARLPDIALITRKTGLSGREMIVAGAGNLELGACCITNTDAGAFVDSPDCRDLADGRRGGLEGRCPVLGHAHQQLVVVSSRHRQRP